MVAVIVCIYRGLFGSFIVAVIKGSGKKVYVIFRSCTLCKSDTLPILLLVSGGSDVHLLMCARVLVLYNQDCKRIRSTVFLFY